MMDNEMEQKKEYVAPQMEIVQFQPQNLLLENSCVGTQCPPTVMTIDVEP